jgi:hypothetical protein
MLDRVLNRFRPRALTTTRVRLAYAIAVAVDAIQLVLGPLGWTFVDEVLDVATAVVMAQLVGFHPLLLPTFVLELIPIADLLPTWTGCVALVIAIRRREEPATTPPPPTGPIIDV